MNQHRAYDPFAEIYDRHWWHFSVDGMPVMERLLLPRLEAGSTILDVGCGTGQPAALLTARGYKIIGLDGSANMLQFARRNAPQAALFVADACSFALAQPADAAISLSDVLNHLLTEDEVAAVLRNIADALKPGAWLLFDLNTEAKYSRHWTGSFDLVEDDQVCVVHASYEEADRIARFDATIFVNQDGWQRSDLTILERCHPDEEIRVALTRSGFGDVAVFDWQRDLDAGGEPAKTFWLCRKTPG